MSRNVAIVCAVSRVTAGVSRHVVDYRKLAADRLRSIRATRGGSALLRELVHWQVCKLEDECHV